MGTISILSVEKLTKNFGGLRALNRISFEVGSNAITSIIGPNGAGKTTTLNIITGHYRSNGGEIFFEGRSISGLKSHEISKLRITRTFQNLQVFGNLTVLENVMVGMHNRTCSEFTSCFLKLPKAKEEEKRIDEESQQILRFLGLANQAKEMSSNLSYGNQKRVEVARALAGDPKLLLLDEPAAGLNLRETLEMAQTVLTLKQKGISIILVEHDMNLVMRISDRIIVLNYGEKIAEGTPREIQQDEKVITAYLGKEFLNASNPRA